MKGLIVGLVALGVVSGCGTNTFEIATKSPLELKWVSDADLCYTQRYRRSPQMMNEIRSRNLDCGAMVVGQGTLTASQVGAERPAEGSVGTVTGVIRSATVQGNNYMKLWVVTGNPEHEVPVWCHGGSNSILTVAPGTRRTQVFDGGKEIPWYELEAGRTVQAVGRWNHREGETKLWADRIDLVTDKAPHIGVIRDRSVMSECGCTMHPVLANGRWDYGHALLFADVSCKAWVNVDGRDVELRAKGRQSGPEVSDVSCRQSPVYEGAGMTVTVDYQAASRCPPEPTECEVTDYDVTLAVQKDGAREAVRGKGQCGC